MDTRPEGKPPRPWKAKFRDAFRGVKLGIRGHSSFFVHFFFTALVLAASAVFVRDPAVWCLLFIVIGVVLSAELFNSALETLVHGLDEETKNRVRPSLDIAAGAVLTASATAIIVGLIAFLSQIVPLFGHN